jgi:hypothetical protein
VKNNVAHGLDHLLQASPSTPPAGRLSVENVAPGATKWYEFARRWFANEAYALITVQNTGPVSAHFHLEAQFLRKVSTVQLFPFAAYGIGERRYDIHCVQPFGGVFLHPGEQHVYRLDFLDGWGFIPELDVTYRLNARTEDGFYLMGVSNSRFGTTFLDEDGGPVDDSELLNVRLHPKPIRALSAYDPASGHHLLALHVSNPMERPFLGTVTQPLDGGMFIVSDDNGTRTGDSVIWEVDLPAGGTRVLELWYQLPDSKNGSLPPAQLVIRDAVNLASLEFSAQSRTFETEEELRLEIERVSGNLLRLTLHRRGQGGYRVQSSSDLVNWLDLQDLDDGGTEFTPEAPYRFYRAVAD